MPDEAFVNDPSKAVSDAAVSHRPLVFSNRRGKRDAGVIQKAARQTYTFIFGRPAAQKFNDRLLHLTLRARGYNNVATGEERFLDFFAKTNPALCVDIGANKGMYSLLLLQKTNARVIAFEPLPQSFDRLKKILDDYPDRFTPENLAIGESDSILTFYYGENTELATFSPEVNQIDYVGATNTNTMEVPVTTLDSYFEATPDELPGIDLIKIDTEGFEREVLVGAQRTIAAKRPKFIQIEFNWHQLLRRQSVFTLAQLLPGYDVYQILPFGAGLVKRDPASPEANIYYWSNFVFVRDDISIA